MTEQWDLGDQQPPNVRWVVESAEDVSGEDSPHWALTSIGVWKGYKNGSKVYLDWATVLRRWGPVELVHYMLPGTHESPGGPECSCGGVWSWWQGVCVSQVQPTTKETTT